MHNSTNYRIRRLSEQGRKAANARWDGERKKQEQLTLVDPIRVGGRILRRIVVIDNETSVRERAFYEFDRPCDQKRKLREVLA